MCVHRLDACTCVLLHVYLDHLYFLVLGRQVPFLPKPKASKTGTQRRSGIGKTKRKGRMVVGETGSELEKEEEEDEEEEEEEEVEVEEEEEEEVLVWSLDKGSSGRP